MTEPVVTVVVRDGDEARLWSLVGEVTRLLDGLPWLLIGGLMVRIIEAEHGRTTSYSTVDVDTVLDVRTVSTAA